MRKRLFFVLVVITALFLISNCTSDDPEDGYAAGESCSTEAQEVCSGDGYSILVCQTGIFVVKKNCNINFGEYCRLLATGPSCKDTGDTGNTGNTG
ncbi:MAG TPA: hypothetical protein PLG63_02870, partial [bacterium]|nr:hypothetical protein [bacterium]